jgi:hypothetical protein
VAGWIVAAVAAQAVAAGPAVPLQAQFEQATAALDAGRWAEAADQFAAIGKRGNISQRTRGIALLRRGQALSSLGRHQEAVEALRQGLTLTPKTEAALAADRVAAALLLGSIELDSYDYAAARGTLERALAETDQPDERRRILLLLVQATTFTDSPAALRYIDEAIRLAPAGDRTALARLHDRKGRVLLAQGNLNPARIELEAALSLLGGVTERTNLDDVVVRSDLAMVLLLMKRDERARELLAMTGAGRMSGENFSRPVRFDLPACGPGLKPDDAAIVEFGVGDDGNVLFAQPVYASRPGMDAAEYARVVRGWAWQPETMKSVPIFYRALTRVELRCSTAGERPSTRSILIDRVTSWIVQQGLTAPVFETDKVSLQVLRAEAAKQGDEPLAHLLKLTALANSPLASYSERRAAADEAIAIARNKAMPVAGMTLLQMIQAEAIAGADSSRRKLMDRYRAILAQPEVSADPVSAGVVRLAIADGATRDDPAQAEQMLAAVAGDDRLDNRDPLRTGARVRLASVQAEMGKLDLARESFAASGLTAQQCALVDARPDLKRSGMGAGVYPAAASLWKTSGWTRAEFDLTADGRTLNRRVVAAYPPFVFSTAVQKGLEDARYTQTYRPEGSLGCGGMTMMVRFQMPH